MRSTRRSVATALPRIAALSAAAIAGSATIVAGGIGCEPPIVSREGMVVFPQQGARGAAVVTANGVELRDRAEIPRPIEVRDVNQAWRAPIGFLLPASGRFTRTSTPTAIARSGLVVVLRASDVLVPAWGGEVLVRVDVIAPAPAASRRAPVKVAFVIADDGPQTGHLLDAALASLGAGDEVAVVDARAVRVVVPKMPASHRSLALAAAQRRITSITDALGREATADVARSIALADRVLGPAGDRRVAVLSAAPPQPADVLTSGSEAAVRWFDTRSPHGGDAGGAGEEGDGVSTAGSASIAKIRAFLPAAGAVVARDLVLSFEGVPSPAHLLESSGGDVRWTLDGGDLAFGDVRVGTARAEVVRISVPPWTPGVRFRLAVSVRVAGDGHGPITVQLPSSYDDDIERIAEARHGDVIAYASALATLHRLHAAFVGDGLAGAGGLRQVARLQARSLALLARDFPDRGFADDAAVLEALLDAAEAE